MRRRRDLGADIGVFVRRIGDVLDGRIQQMDRHRWISLIVVPIVLLVALESVCLGIVYFYNSLSGRSNASFAPNHLLTRLFAPAPVRVAGVRHFR